MEFKNLSEEYRLKNHMLIKIIKLYSEKTYTYVQCINQQLSKFRQEEKEKEIILFSPTNFGNVLS